MSLSNDQIIALRAAVFNDSASAAFIVAGDAAGLRARLNSLSNPAYIVWRKEVSQDEIMQNGFDWVRVDNLSVGKARIWEWLFANEMRVINPSKLNVRSGIDEAWRGTQADLDVRAAIYVHCKRTATVAEKLMASGTGTTLVPASMSFEGEVSDLDSARMIFKDDGSIWTAGG